MSRFFFGILALIALLIAIVVVAPGLIPVSAYKGQIENAASASLGRQVTIGEGLRFKLVPQTAFHVTDLEIANPDGFTGPYLAHVKEADIGVKLLPLLKKNVEIERFILTEPDMKLERAKDGAVNWNLAAGEAKEAAESTGAETSVGDIKLGDVRIVNGKATFADAAAGKTYTMGDINLAVRLASLAEPLEADGTLTFEGAPSKVDIVLTSLRKMLDKEPANLKLDMTLGDSSASGDLVVDTKDTLSYSGPVTLNAPNLPQFAALMGAPLADAPGFDTLAVEGTATGGDTFLKLANAKINFDKIDATGSLALNWAGARPKATGALAAGTLDLRPYLPPPSDSASGFPAWSEDKLDLTSLRNIDADIDMTANEIYLNDMKFGASQLKLTINDGRMVADIPELGLYGGGGSGQLVVNAKNATPTFAGKFDLGSVEAQPFVKDVMKNDRLLGLGGFKLDFSANGSSQAAIMRSLDGSGRFDIADGAIKGINLAKLARSVAEIQQGGLNPTAITSAIATAQKPDEQTDFSELLSQFSIADGLVNAPTISLAGPFVTMTGTGNVNLPNQTLDLRLSPKASTTMDNKGGKSIAIPMRVTGTFSEPKIVIDLETLLKGRAEQGLRDIISGATKKSDDKSSTDKTDTETEKKSSGEKALDTLKGILGPTQEETDDDGTDTEASASPSSTDAVASEAINAIFGAAKKSSAAKEEEPQDADPN